MASILKCKQYDMLNLKLKKGQIYYCTDTNFLYKDYGSTTSNRIRLNAKILSNEYERLEKIIPSMNKMYYVIATNNLYLYNGKWTFIAGDNKEYNTYSYYESTGTLSPVISVDEYITSKTTGDVIIDNNGLLGDGSVVIRDSDRIAKGLLEIDGMYNRLNIKSYLANGINLIPNANKNYNDYGMKTGTLQLNMTTDNNQPSGFATYNGDWYNYGDQYIITKNTLEYNIYPDEISNKDICKTFIEFYYEYGETNNITLEETKYLYKCYLTIKLNSLETNPNKTDIENTHIPNIDMNVLVIDAKDKESVVKNDSGTPIFTKATVNMQYDLSTSDNTINAIFKREEYENIYELNSENEVVLIEEFKDININTFEDMNLRLTSQVAKGVLNKLTIENIPLYKINGREKYSINDDGNVIMESEQHVYITVEIIERHVLDINDKLISTNVSYDVIFNNEYDNGTNNEFTNDIEKVINDEYPLSINIQNWNKSKVLTVNDLYLILNGMLAIEDLL